MFSATEDTAFLTGIEILSGKHAEISMVSDLYLILFHLVPYTLIWLNIFRFSLLLNVSEGFCGKGFIAKKLPFSIISTSYFVKCTVLGLTTNMDFNNFAIKR